MKYEKFTGQEEELTLLLTNQGAGLKTTTQTANHQVIGSYYFKQPTVREHVIFKHFCEEVGQVKGSAGYKEYCNR